METGFLKYIVYIIICISVLVMLTVLLLRRRVGGKSKKQKREPVSCGNVSVLFDRDMNVTVIPYMKDKYGVGKPIPAPQFFKYPYTSEKLGELLRNSLNLCRKGSPGSGQELMARLNSTDWVEFCEDKRNISVYFNEKHGIVFNSTVRKRDGSYQFNMSGLEKVLDGRASDLDLGNTLLSLLPRCR